jgi:hypothetical protein
LTLGTPAVEVLPSARFIRFVVGDEPTHSDYFLWVRLLLIGRCFFQIKAQLRLSCQVEVVPVFGAGSGGYDESVFDDFHEPTRLQFLHALTKTLFQLG